MHHAVILNVGTVFHHNTANRAQAGIWASMLPLTQDHITNKYRRQVEHSSRQARPASDRQFDKQASSLLMRL